MKAKSDRIGTLLVKRGMLGPEALEGALREQAASGRRLGEVLVEQGLIGEEALRWALAEQLDLPLVHPDPATLDPEALALISPDLCRRYGVLPLHLSFETPGREPVLTIAVADPSLKPAFDDLAKRVGRPLHIAAALREDIETALTEIYGPGPEGDVAVHLGPIAPHNLARVFQDPTGTALLRELLETSVARKEEILHLRSREGECRITDSRGGLVFSGGQTWHTILLDRLRRLAGIAGGPGGEAPRILQKGRFAFPAADADPAVLFRVSILRGVEGEEAQIRLVRREGAARSLAEIGLSAPQAALVRRALARPGLVWVTASGDGGLASTLFSLLRAIPGEGRTFTIEEEVFYRTPEFLQLETLDLGQEGRTQVLRELKYLDFPRIMLDRASPAELGDLLSLAVRRRWVLAGAPEASLEETLSSLSARASEIPLFGLTLVVHQRLFAALCPHCREPAVLSAAERRAVGRLLVGEPGTFYQEGPGCEECEGCGRRGSRAFFELLPVDAGVRDALYAEAKGERRIAGLVERVSPTIASQVAEAAARGEIGLSSLWEFV